MNPHLSIVSPVYRAAECLPELYRRLVAVASQITPDFELVLVEDYGPDQSWAILQDIAARDSRVKALRLSRNFGQHYAITAGLDHACGDWVVVMDCDLQDPPEEIPHLYRKAQEGFDIVFARRMNRVDDVSKKLTGALFYVFLSWLTGQPYDRTVANFSISSRKVVVAFRAYRERDRSFPAIIRQLGFSRASIDVAHAPRYAGETSYTMAKLMAFALQNIVTASTRPLYMSIRFGALVALFSTIYTIYLIVKYFVLDARVAGFTTLAVLISFFSGLLFVQLGVIGLYLGRMFEQSKNRPLYHISEKLNVK